jgi:hypothetical protein
MRKRRVALGALAITLLCTKLSTKAHAQPAAHDAAGAQALFDDGKSLMELGNFAEACPKLVESQRLDPAGGTLLVIALCHERAGKTATAWAAFDEAAGQARIDRRADREQVALDHEHALESKLTKIRIAVAGGPGVQVRRDGMPVGEAQWGTPVPVDPGPHEIEASAPGKTSWRSTVQAEGAGQVIDVAVPALADEPRVAPIATRPGSMAAPVESPSYQKTGALIVGGVGVVALGVGAGFGFAAESSWHEVQRECPGGKCLSSTASDVASRAGSQADLSSLFFAIGGLGVATCAILYLTAPSSSAVHLSPVVGRGTLGIGMGGVL